MRRTLENALNRWYQVGLLDSDSVSRIRRFEETDENRTLRWPVIAAWSFGGLMILAGVLLFVSANWDVWSPGERFGAILVGVLVFHLLGVIAWRSQPVLARVFHSVGTVTCGAGIFLAGQVFHLDEHWPTGFMLWAVAALAGWFLLRDWVQMVLVALLAPVWLLGEWALLTEFQRGGEAVAAAGITILAITYLSAPGRGRNSPLKYALGWIGGLALIPAMIAVAATSYDHYGSMISRRPAVSEPLLYVGWAVAVLAPLTIALVLKKRKVWINGVSAAFVVLLAHISFRTPVPFILCGLFSIGLIWWGVNEARRERINLGVAGFGLTVLFFYFSNVMDKLDRSLGLIGFGILFLLLGYCLTRLRGRLLSRFGEGQS